MKDNHFKVRIQCPTYNQASYIEDAMNGFCMQQTDFPFLAVVVDDASTDGEPEVIKHYLAEHFDNEALDLPTPDETDEYVRVFARHKENKNCYFLVMFLKYNHYSIKKLKLTSVADLLRPIPYIAMCEGDDYWIDPKKLQRQVDFLEGHEEYVMCAHNSITRDGNTGAMGCFNGWFDKSAFNYEDIISKDWFLPTQSLLYRRDVCVRNRIEKSFHNGDYCLQLCLTRDGGLVHYSNECMSVYRRGVGISKNDTYLKNNLRLIDLLEYMSTLSDEKYKKVFDDRIDALKQCNVKIDLEERNINSIWYKVRYKLLVLFIKLLRFKNPGVGVKIIH